MMRFSHKHMGVQLNILASEHKITRAVKIAKDTVLAETIVDPEDGKQKRIVLAGTIYPNNNASAVGIVLNDIDVTYSDAAVAILTHGAVNKNLLPTTPSAEAEKALSHIDFRVAMTTLPFTMSLAHDMDVFNSSNIPATTDVFVVANNFRFLPLAEKPDLWECAGVSGAKLVECELKNERLIRMTINLVECKTSTGILHVAPTIEITSAKGVIPVVEVLKCEGNGNENKNNVKGDK